MQSWLYDIIQKQDWTDKDENLISILLHTSPDFFLKIIDNLLKFHQGITGQPPVGLTPQQENEFWELVNDFTKRDAINGSIETQSSEFPSPSSITYIHRRQKRKRSYKF